MDIALQRRKPGGKPGEPKGTPLPYLRDWRRARGLSQLELARRAGMTNVVISRLETGTVLGARHETIARLAKALRIRQHELIRVHPREAFARQYRQEQGQGSMPTAQEGAA